MSPDAFLPMQTFELCVRSYVGRYYVGTRWAIGIGD